MSFKDEETKLKSVLLADEVKAKTWLTENKITVLAFIAGVIIGVIVRSLV